MTEAADPWEFPQKVDIVTQAFPADVTTLLPAWEDIPDEFKGRNHKENVYTDVAAQWFYRGLPATTKFVLYEGVNGDFMIQHLGAILGSFQPKHEHKLAGVAYLLSRWCDKITDYTFSEED